MEIAAPWSRLPLIFAEVRAAMLAVPHTRAATCHLSHSYSDGACLYFTFAFTHGLFWSHVPTKDIEHPMRGDAGRLQVLRFAQDDSTYFVAKASSPCGAGE